jgi:serine-type D-Ala-D-Ala carboxypeptidase (penicillin-binding protein 5/6)
MLSFFITILIAPFLPIFMYSNLPIGINLNEKNDPQVLGKAGEREAEACVENPASQKYNLFPLDWTNTSGFTPMRKPDFQDIKIWAGASVVIDVDSGTILEYSSGRKQVQVASLTKMMTAVLVVEEIEDLDTPITITKDALNVYGTVVGCPTSVFCNGNRFQVGEQIAARDVLKAMLLNSANDAATALAIHIAGTHGEFVKMMNEKAKSLGLKDTNFCTASGLEADGRETECYSSAYDIARIAAYSLKHEIIWDMMRIEEDEIYSLDGKISHQLKNTDLLLSQMSNCLGGKTGFTPMAGKSLLLAAADPSGKHKIIAVILNDENRWENMKNLVDWAFDNYEWR